MFRLASHVAQGSSNFSGSESFNFSSSFVDELQPCSVVQVMSDSYLLTATVSIVLLSMVSFVFQPCTGNKRRLSVNGNGVYSSVFF